MDAAQAAPRESEGTLGDPGRTRLGVVVIGRNEGQRLERCLRSLLGRADRVVYVDSGSSDGSQELARSLGVELLELERDVPFTAARARNAGLGRLRALEPELRWVQFVDGDCEVREGWLERGRARLEQEPRLAAVCGRVRERRPGASLYNRVIDLEWDSPVGRTLACGGNAMMRVEALAAVGGFDPGLICGEEPELCLRLRRAGWEIERLEAEMVLHDVAMERFGQWWRRALRGGWAIAEGAHRHGAGPERYNRRRARSAWFWGALLPLASAALAWPTLGLAPFLAALGYALLAWRIFQGRRARGASLGDAGLYAAFTTLAKLPEALGQARYWLTRWRGAPATLIEYKRPAPAVAG